MLVFSFGFDGHSASEGPRVVHALASMTHVAAGSVWAGGLVAMAVVIGRRRRDVVETKAMEMVLRFSTMAIVALIAVTVAGAAIAWLIETDLGAYVSTEWGRVLLVKLGIVGVAAAFGAYNHFRLLPALRSDPHDEGVLDRTRLTVTAEAALLVAATLATAVLVGSSTI